MKVIIHDLDPEYEALIEEKCDHAVDADGRYAPCQGCFGCWTKHPAECFMKDKLQQVCRVIGRADELVIVTKISMAHTARRSRMSWTVPSGLPRRSAPTVAGRCTTRFATENMIFGKWSFTER